MHTRAHTRARAHTHTHFFEDLVEFVKKEFLPCGPLCHCCWFDGSITPPHLWGASSLPSTVLGGRPGGRSPNPGIGRTEARGAGEASVHPGCLAGLCGRACQESYGELALVQTSSRNTENNHILLIIAKENTLRSQLNYITTSPAGWLGLYLSGSGFSQVGR